MKKLAVLSLLTLLVWGCKNNDYSTNDIIEKSIKFHDPLGNWAKLKAKFIFDSRFSFNDSVPEELHISIDVPENGFRYHNLDRGVDIEFEADSCIIHRGIGTCDGYNWTKNFYTYVWGLPMKLKDPGVKPEKGILDTVINNLKCYQVRVNYPNENFKFYFDQTDFQLRAFEFLKNDSSGKGEVIYLKDLKEFQGIKFPKHKTWMHLDNSLIGTNAVLGIEAI